MQATFCVKFSSDFRQRHCTHMPSLSPVDFSLFNIPLSFDRRRFVDAAGNVQTIERKQTDDTARIERKISHSLAPEFRINEAWPRFNKPRDYFHPRRGQTFPPNFIHDRRSTALIIHMLVILRFLLLSSLNTATVKVIKTTNL